MGARLGEPTETETLADRRSTDLGGGRVVTYWTYGDPAGDPVLLFHGTPGSGKLGALYEEVAREQSVYIIAPDRPGYGGSSPRNGWEPSDVREVMVHVIDDEGVESVDLLAFSGGAPFALALGADCPARVNRITLVSGSSPPSMGDAAPLPIRLVGHAAVRVPGIADAVYGLQHRIGQRRPEVLVEQLTTGDRSVPAAVCTSTAAAILEGIGEQRDGAVAESRLFVRDWEIDLSSVTVPVEIFHGDEDTNASLSGVQALAEELPDASLDVLTGRDHLGTLRETRQAALQRVGQ